MHNESATNHALSLQADAHAAECARWAAVLAPVKRTERAEFDPTIQLCNRSIVLSVSMAVLSLGAAAVQAFASFF